MADYFKRVQQCTPTRFWINNVTREEAELAIAAGAVGCTQNPSYTWKMLQHPAEREYAERLLQEILVQEPDDRAALVRLQLRLISRIAERFLPIYRQTRKKFGYVSIQGDPFREDAKSIIEFAHLHRTAGENIMVKIPVTEEGLRAIRILAAEGIPINATECMAVRQVLDVCDAYVDATQGMPEPAPLYFSVISGIFDEYLQKSAQSNHIDISRDTLWQAGICVAKKVAAIVAEREYPCGFIGGGARGLHHFTEMVGAPASITINWKGTADALLAADAPVVSRFLQPTPHSVIDELVEKLPDFRRAYFIHAIEPHEYEEFGPVVLFRTSFENDWRSALDYIRSCRQADKRN